jgi:hypothetical protein
MSGIVVYDIFKKCFLIKNILKWYFFKKIFLILKTILKTGTNKMPNTNLVLK